MNMYEALEQSQDHARAMLVSQFDKERGIPKSASSHPDLWLGDRWSEAYIAADLPDKAEDVMASIARSQRPDGSFPHLMQGSHKTLGAETRWIDRQVYRMQGNGALHLPNGEWVTKSYAPATQALGALAMQREGLKIPESLNAGSLTKAALALYAARGVAEDSGYIAARHKDELTNNSSPLAAEIKKHGFAADPAINALFVKNAYAARKLVSDQNGYLDNDMNKLADIAHSIHQKLADWLHYVSSEDKEMMTMTHEEVLASARLQLKLAPLSDARLTAFYAAPDPNDKNRGKNHLSMAECIEVARLTPYSEASHDYLQRILPKIAVIGSNAITRFEDVSPGAMAVANKAGRKQVWLPTAAQIVRISPSAV